MRLCVFASGSDRNGYLLYNENEALVIEAGVSVRNVIRQLKGNVGKISGCLISHEHEDHSKYIRQYMEHAIDVYCSKGTADALNLKETGRLKTGENWVPFRSGGFTVRPFLVHHDAREPFGYLIHHPETGYILFATDTYYLDRSFSSGLNQIMLECNYHMDLLNENTRSGRIHSTVRNRTMRSHMEYGQCLATIRSNNLQKVSNIVLLHLSVTNADPERFRQGIIQATGKRVFIARKGLDIDFNMNPFI